MKLRNIISEAYNPYRRHSEYNDPSDYYDNTPDLGVSVELCANNDEEYAEIIVQPDVSWYADEDQYGRRIRVPEIQDIIIDEAFTFLGKQYQKGKSFPTELMMFLCGVDGAALEVPGASAILHKLTKKDLSSLRDIAAGHADDKSRQMKEAVWIHKVLKPQGPAEFNQAIQLIKRLQQSEQIFYNYVEDAIRERLGYGR